VARESFRIGRGRAWGVVMVDDSLTIWRQGRLLARESRLMKSLRPFHITTRGAARLGLWLLVGGGVAFYAPTLRERLTKPSAKVDTSLDDAIAATIRNGEWRYAPTPPGETMRENARRALPNGPLMRENALFALPDSALLSYEASKRRPDQDDA